MKEAKAAEVKDENMTEFKSEIVLNDVDEFCRAVGQANAEKQHLLEKSKQDADLEELKAKKVRRFLKGIVIDFVLD